MKNIHEIAFHPGSREELLPDFAADFPYIASRAEMDCYIGRSAPWHWHKAVEIFYMESGSLTYYTPGGAMYFPTGSGGMINSNVLHMTKAMSRTEENVPLLHLFDPSLIAGEPPAFSGKSGTEKNSGPDPSRFPAFRRRPRI